MQFPKSAERPSGPCPWSLVTLATSFPTPVWDISHPTSAAPSHDSRLQFCFGGNDSFSTFNPCDLFVEYFHLLLHMSRLELSRTFHSSSFSDWLGEEHIPQLEQSGLTKSLVRAFA